MASNRTFASQGEVKKGIIAAICNLYLYDRELLKVDANERSITHRLAEHLRIEFPNWNVGCEYNRRGYQPKRLRVASWPVRADDTEAKTVFPDIIIHKRRTNQNLAVIEVKKAGGQTETKNIQKLEEFTEAKEYCYQYGLFLKLAIDSRSELVLFKHGHEQALWTDDLRTALQELGNGR